MTHLNDSLLSTQLIKTVMSQLAIDWRGIHGITHWARVLHIGMHLAKKNGANSKVVQLFALFHDSKRMTEGSDPDHGPRAAQFALNLHEMFFKLGGNELHLLVEACRKHTSSADHENMTVKTCFDADRLDLGRVGIRPDKLLLCTDEAKQAETISWAYRQSLGKALPHNVLTTFYQENIV